MSTTELERKAREIKEWQRIAEDATAAAEALRDEIKQTMTAQDTDTLTAGAYKITWRTVTTNRLDTTALRAALPDLAARYTTTTTTRRFCIN